jgi:hypothetical protein
MQFPFTSDIIVPFIFTVGIISLSQFVIPSDEIKIFVSFMILIPIHLVYRSFRMPIAFSIALLMISNAAMMYDNMLLANQIATYSFWLLSVGLILLTVKYFRFESNRNNIESAQVRNMGTHAT